MKRMIVTIVLAISFAQISFAQSDDRWQQQIEQFQQRMQEMAEQMAKQFGGNNFYFDTSFVMPFDARSFDGMNFPFDSSFTKHFEFRFDGDNFSFDTSMVKGFRWYGDSEGPMQIDTLHFRHFGPDDFPGFQFDGEWTKGMSEMMEQLMKQFEGFGEQFKDENGQHFYYREWKSTPEEGENPKPQPKPAPKQKRKTTTI